METFPRAINHFVGSDENKINGHVNFKSTDGEPIKDPFLK